jgi:hypothetical protein
MAPNSSDTKRTLSVDARPAATVASDTGVSQTLRMISDSKNYTPLFFYFENENGIFIL